MEALLRIIYLGNKIAMNGQILLVEDNKTVHKILLEALRKENYSVLSAFDGAQAMFHFEKSAIDLVVLDLILPDMEGKSIIEAIRKTANTPILIISAKNTDVDKAEMLTLGADDYLAKPFSMIEFIARTHAAIRRYRMSHVDNKQVKTIGDLEFHLYNYMFYNHGLEIPLTKKEAQILELFFNNPNKIITKKQLYEAVWNEPYYDDENVINVHMKRIRNKIEKDSTNPEIILTVWGIGYQYKE